MQLTTLASVIEALYFSNLLDTEEATRGGLMLVAQPESLKSEILKVLKPRTGVCFQDDLNVAKISRLRPLIATGHITALVLPEFQKIFERREDTAMNTLGHLRAFVHDGIYESPHDEMYSIEDPATCSLFAALTVECYNKNIKAWTNNGFARRVLWVHYKLMTYEKELIREANRLRVGLELFTTLPFVAPVGMRIPSTRTLAETGKIDALVEEFVDVTKVPHRIEVHKLLYRVFDVLRWQAQKGIFASDPMATMEDFVPSLTTRVELKLPDHLINQLAQLREERERMEQSKNAPVDV